MPNSGICRMTSRWHQPEPFRTRVIRHSLAPAECGNTRNTEQARMGFAQGVRWRNILDQPGCRPSRCNWRAHPKEREDLMANVEIPVKHNGLCRMEPSVTSRIRRIHAVPRAVQNVDSA